MSDTLTTFKKFTDGVAAQQLEQLLIDNKIQCLLVDNSSRLGAAFSGDLQKEYEIQIQQEDFVKAQQLLEQQAESLIDEVPEDYYLLTFTNNELYDVLVKRDEWSEFDYILAKHLLEERGRTINEDDVLKIRRQRLLELATPEKNHKGWIIAGYIFAFLGGLFGVTTGYVLMTAQKSLPDGSKVYTYTSSDRAHGKTIFVLGLIVLAFCVALKVMKFF
jgi:hypothetical protein